MLRYYDIKIKEYREKAGLTQQQLADLIGGDVSQISRYENGFQLPPHDKMIRLADLFHTSIEELLGLKRTERQYTDDGTPILDIKRAEVARSQLFSGVNDPYVTITPDGIKFSTSCVRKWVDTDYIQIIVDEVQGLLIIRKSSEEDMDSQRWTREKDGKKYPRKITGREFSALIYVLMNWSKGYRFRICGSQAVNADDNEEELLFFELVNAEGIPLSSNVRKKCGVKDEEIDSDVLKALDEVEKKKEEEMRKRKQMREEGKSPGPMEKYICYPDQWGQYRFGLPIEIHDIKPEIHLGTLKETGV